MLDIPFLLRVDVDPWVAAQNDMNDMGVCDAIERYAPSRKPPEMSTPHLPKVAGINPPVPHPAHTAAAIPDLLSVSAAPGGPAGIPAAVPPGAVIQDRLAGWVSDLTTLHELTERLAGTDSLNAALHELLDAGAALVGARRGMVVLEPPPDAAPMRPDRFGPDRGSALTRGLGFSHAELGYIETIPRSVTAYGRVLESHGQPPAPAPPPLSAAQTPAPPPLSTAQAPVTPLPPASAPPPSYAPEPATLPEAVAHPDLLGDPSLDPRHREVALRLGYTASYTQPLASAAAGTLGAAVWMYDEPTAPGERRRRLVGLYARYAAEHLARLLELEHARETMAAVAEELLPSRLPRVPGVRLAARHRTGPRGGGDWYDALPLPEGALGLAVGSVSGSGPSALAAMGRLRASLRAYAVMEGEDPVAVLSDLELLLRLTEPARTATALFAYAEPAARKVVLAGAGHTPPLVIGERRTEYVETSLSAPLGMLACWEAPSVELSPEPGETVLLYTDGLLRRTGEPMDRAFARLHTAAAGVPRAIREDPGAVADHVLNAMLGADRGAGAGGATSRGTSGGTGRGTSRGTSGVEGAGDEDIVLLAARFD
ncbi:PP2C family protein-serine/threonine phosphatase [Streptomyces jumonjinensis]|uniref:PP2C family protein-serine/threonine phosphatase n=1 Tax=Streptomyces jumonjinensis TaxID=1945 RepID=UPI0037A84929